MLSGWVVAQVCFIEIKGIIIEQCFIMITGIIEHTVHIMENIVQLLTLNLDGFVQ